MELFNKSETKSKKLLFLLFFIFLVCDSSFFMIKRTSGTMRIVIDLLVACGFLFYLRPKITIKSLGLLCILIIFPLVWVLFSGDVKQTAIICLVVFVGWVVAVSISRRTFLILYDKAMFFLSAFSLVSLLIYHLFPAVVKSFPIAEQNAYLVSYNLIFSVITETDGAMRNYGIFWEPGGFAVFLCIALWSELFIQKTSLIKIIVYFVAIATTFSTFGIITGMVLIISYMFHNKQVNKTVKSMVILSLLIAVIWVMFYGDEFIYTVFGKITNMTDSTTTRLNSLVYVGELFLSSPILGVGISDFLDFSSIYLSGMATFTFLNCLAMHGFIGGLIPVIGSFKFFLKINSTFLSKLVLFFFCILLFSTQAFEQISFFYALVISGFLTTGIEKERIDGK